MVYEVMIFVGDGFFKIFLIDKSEASSWEIKAC